MIPYIVLLKHLLNLILIYINLKLLACIINAACLALINAAVPMKFTIAAVCCMIEENTDNIILDPNNSQLEVCKLIYISIRIF